MDSYHYSAVSEDRTYLLRQKRYFSDSVGVSEQQAEVLRSESQSERSTGCEQNTKQHLLHSPRYFSSSVSVILSVSVHVSFSVRIHIQTSGSSVSF